MTPKQDSLYYGFRRCVTGCTEYRFFKGNKPLGRAAAYVGPNFPVYLEGCGQVLRSEMDPEMTIFPGCFRDVPSADGKGLYARVIYRDTGQHSLQTGFGTIEAEHGTGNYRFFQGNAPVARLRSITAGMPGPLSGEDDWQLHTIMTAEAPLADALALMMLAFPLLQISL